ncbi:MAG: YibL family ribosome-associated protein [Oceanicoccus sp.]
MNLKQELQNLNNRLDKYRSKLSSAERRDDKEVIAQATRGIEKITKKITNVKGQQTSQLSGKGHDIKSLAFSRALTKAEQADMGKLKKSVRGLIVVHPMTALGREIQVDVVTGYAPSKF